MRNAELERIEQQLLDALPVIRRVLKKCEEPRDVLERMLEGAIGWLRHGDDELAAEDALKSLKPFPGRPGKKGDH